uniref:DUF2975 domain-containing protein n=1 Tax=Alistipes sp. TaxID=1872444 RepID=UPI00405609B0
MERADKRALNRRLRFIYIGYFVILALGFMHSVVPLFARSLREGIQQVELREQTSEQEPSEWILVAVRPRLYQQTIQLGESLEMEPIDGLLSIEVDPTAISKERYEGVMARYEASFYLDFFVIGCWIAILVLIAMIIGSLRSSIRDEHPLPQINILYMRLIGGLIILAELCEGVIYTLGHRAVELLTAAPQGSYGEFFPIEYGTLVLGLLIFFSAEIFAVGSRLSEEQRLTI